VKTYVLDFETYYSKEYTLKKLTPVEYVLDPRFEAIGCAIKEGIDAKPYWVDGEDLPRWFADAPRDIATVTHNALFDNCIMAWRYNYVPKLMFDTLGIARATLAAHLRSLSLASVAQYLELGVKGRTVHKVEGMPRAAIRALPALWEEYKQYSCDDAELCGGIFRKLVIEGGFPMSELLVMDNVLRCAVEPKFILDQNLLAKHRQEIQQEKDLLLTRAALVGCSSKDDLMSNDKFAAFLRHLGVEPPMKTSPVTGRQSYAFAKTDQAFVDLMEHENPGVQVAVAARLGHKSTLEESRCERLQTISHLTWEGNQQLKLMPMPLKFSGAHTHRLSGDWKLNMQNLPRGGTLRSALTAPPDHVVYAVDASQIEARIVAWICNVVELIEAFAAGKDVYSLFASGVFGRAITKADKLERFIGKTCILGLGYGVGWPKLQSTIKLGAKAQLKMDIEVPDLDAQNYVQTYRRQYYQIPATWRALGQAIPVLAGLGGGFKLGPCTFHKGEIIGPSGLKLYYPELEMDAGGNWSFTFGGKRKRIYGGALLENIVQHLARVLVMDAAMRIRKRMLPFALQVHDELVYVIRRELVEQLHTVAMEEMRRRPLWGPTLPLDAEGHWGDNYGGAK
jgi:DNA polymerase